MKDQEQELPPYNHLWREVKDGRYLYPLGQEDNWWWTQFNRQRKKTLDNNNLPW